MKRLYFLLPDLNSATRVVDDLRALAIDSDQIYVVGNDHVQLEQAHLHEAGVLHGTAVLSGLTKGMALGGTTGLLAGIAAVTFPPAGIVLAGGAVVGMGVLGAGFGAWLGSMLGIAATDPGIQRFEDEIKRGELLMMVDVRAERELEISEQIRRSHPEARIESVPRQRLGFLSAPGESARSDPWDSKHF